MIVVFDEYGPVRMIRDKKYKYIHRFNCDNNELYDLENDPGEGCNLNDDPAMIDQWILLTVISVLDGSNYNTMKIWKSLRPS